MLHMVTLVSLALLLLFAVQGMGQNLITPEQAMNAVRAFEGDPNLEFETIELERGTSGPPWNYEEWGYLLEAKENYPDGHSWVVDAQTGEVVWAYYAGTKPDASDDPFGQLTKEKCRQIAENFARAKYANFGNMNLELCREHWTGTGWLFEWRQKLVLGAWGINGVEIEVNPIDGHIQVYRAIRIEQIQPSREPQITAEGAIEIAKKALGIVTVTGVSGPTLQADQQGNLTWSLALGGRDDEGNYNGAAIKIDAQTGKVLYTAYEGDKLPSSTLVTLKEPIEDQMLRGYWWIGIIAAGVLVVGVVVIAKARQRRMLR